MMAPFSPRSPWLSFILVALALVAGTMGATMPSPLYPLYETAWGLVPSDIAVIYVAYMAGVVASFLFLGRLSARFGALPVLKAGLVVVLAGLALCALAPDRTVLILGRAVIGVASGLITSAATLGLIETEPAGPGGRASIIASSVTMAGFGLGPFVTGLVGQWAPAPLLTPYAVVFVLAGLVLAGLAVFAGRGQRPEPPPALSFMPRLVLPAQRGLFLIAGFAVFCAYALFSLIASLAPSFIAGVLPWHGPAVSGTFVAAVLFCSASVQWPGRRLDTGRGLTLALGLMSLGSAGLGYAGASGSILAFAAADIVIGMGHGLAFMSGLGLVNRIGRQEGGHAGILASFLTIGYLGTIVPILGIGLLADRIGLGPAIAAFCAGTGGFCLLLLAACRGHRRPAPVRSWS
ncbi:MFS transporter [Zavarzinia compransoris]|nr:MFS transporter [Zavarzinia compransoris]